MAIISNREIYPFIRWNRLIHFMPRAEMEFVFEVSLAEHCNLNCAGCDHFSPLAEPEFADYEEMARDFERLSSLFHGHAKEIRLLGGEPLLHPDLIKFFGMARRNFPDAVIIIVTNGLKLLDQPEEFWLACKENDIAIRPTKYPIPLDFKEMEKRAADYGVKYGYYGNSGIVTKTVNFYRLDVEGRQDIRRNFLFCLRANNCISLRHGKLYTCSVAPTARHLGRYFGKDLEACPEDSIDIYRAISAREILEFLTKPIPFCRHCMVDDVRWDQPWSQSSRKIEEWM